MLTLEQIPSLRVAAPVVVIAKIRNERVRLPGLLAHYRAMGVRAFVFIDNGSSDGSTDYLAEQTDVEIVSIPLDFRLANQGMDWVNAVRAALPAASWTIYVDADEYLVYDGWPEVGIDAYLAGLPDACNAVVGFMLDMYPRAEVASVRAGDDLLAGAPCFDRHYHFRRRPQRPWDRSAPNIEFVGGPRVRTVSSLAREARTGWITYALRGQLDRLLRIVPARWRRVVIEAFPATMPALKKTPILRGHDIHYANSHDTRGAVYARMNCVLLHFKFTSEFINKIDQEIERGQYYRFGAEYMYYRKHGLADRGITLFSTSESATFKDSRDLTALDLIRPVDQFFS